MDHFYTVREAATVLRVSPQAVRSLVAVGRLKHYKPGRNILIPSTTLKRYIEDGEGAACKVRWEQ